jgi:hypothetical protein
MEKIDATFEELDAEYERYDKMGSIPAGDILYKLGVSAVEPSMQVAASTPRETPPERKVSKSSSSKSKPAAPKPRRLTTQRQFHFADLASAPAHEGPHSRAPYVKDDTESDA